MDVSTEYCRLAKVHFLLGDAAKARERLALKPKIGFEELIKIIVDADLRKKAVEIIV